MGNRCSMTRGLLPVLALAGVALLQTSGRTQDIPGRTGQSASTKRPAGQTGGRLELENTAIGRLSRQLRHFRSTGDLESAARVFDQLFPKEPVPDPVWALKNAAAVPPSSDEVMAVTKSVAASEGAFAVFVSQEREKNPTADIGPSTTGAPSLFSAAEQWAGEEPRDIRVRKSSDLGLTWPETFLVGDGLALTRPSLRLISDERVGLAYVKAWDPADGDIWFTGFGRDMMAGAGSPVALSLADQMSPSLATDRQGFATPYVYVVYAEREGPTGSVRLRVSRDLGASWSRDVTIDSFPWPEGATIGTALAFDPGGTTLYVAYTRPQGLSTGIAVASSTNFGASWSGPVFLTAFDLRPDGAPAVAAGGGTVIVVYEHGRGGPDRDIRLAYSTDGGRNWTRGIGLASTAAAEFSPDVRASEGPAHPRFFVSYIEEGGRVRVLSAEGATPGSWTTESTIPEGDASLSLGTAIVLPVPGPGGGSSAGTLWSDTTADEDIYFSGPTATLNLATMTVTPDNRDVPYTAGTTTFAVAKAGAGQVNWMAAVTSGEDWLSIASGTSGTNAGTITAAYLGNPSTAPRIGTIRVTAAEAGIPAVDVTVNQAGAPLLDVTPTEGFGSEGTEGGPFDPSAADYTLGNAGGSAMTWTATATATWLSVTPAAGTLEPGATVTVSVALNAAADALTVGVHTDTIAFTNTTNDAGTTTRPATLTVNARPGTLAVAPLDGLDANGVVGGPFSPPAKDYLLQNTGATAFDWTAGASETWLSVSAASGTLEPGESTTVTISIGAAADSLAAGAYAGVISFTNVTNGRGSASRSVSLTVTTPGALTVSPAEGLAATGTVGGPFVPSSRDYTLQNTGGTAISWTAAGSETWTALSAGSGALEPGASTTITISLNTAADTLAAGTYSDTIHFTNTTNGEGTTSRTVDLTVVEPGALEVWPAEGLASTGTAGGPFTPQNREYRLSNTGGSPISWTATKTQAWLDLSAVSGTLDVGYAAFVTVSLNAEANALAPGTYSDTVTFTNTTDGAGTTTRQVNLTVVAPGALLVSPADGLTSSGLVGGPFSPSVQIYTLQNTGGTEIAWAAANTEAWTTLSNTSGTLGAGATAIVAVTITSAANALPAGDYADAVTFANTTNGAGDTSRPISLTITTPGMLVITPADGLVSTGPLGGPFAPSSLVYTLQNTGGTALSWAATKTQAWTTLSFGSGSLAPGASTTVTVSINAEANALAVGAYGDTVSFVDQTFGADPTTREISLTVSAPGVLSVTPSAGLSSSGFTGGPFTPSSQLYTLQNTGGTAISWTAARTQAWTTLSAGSGSLAPGASATVTVSINGEANTLAAGSYNDTVTFANTTNGAGTAARTVSLAVTAPGALSVVPSEGLVSAGLAGGPFIPASRTYTLQNTGGATIAWTAARTETWTTLSSVSGTLAAGASTSVTVSINTWANALTTGTYSDTVTLTNTTNGRGTTTRPVSLTVGTVPALSVSPAGRDVDHLAGTATFAVSNTGGGTMDWTAAVVAGGGWLQITSGANGTEAGTITVSFAANRTAAARVGIVRITAPGASGSPKDVTLTQARGSISLGLGVERLVEKAWVIQREYALLTVTAANPAAIPVDRYVIYKKYGDLEFRVREEIPGSASETASWTYTDTFLETGMSYAYRVVALDALGNVISESNVVTI
jgi:hypothetical protein